MMKFAGRIAILGMLICMSCVAQTKKADGSSDVSPGKLERILCGARTAAAHWKSILRPGFRQSGTLNIG
jgi:hypothetical protein